MIIIIIIILVFCQCQSAFIFWYLPIFHTDFHLYERSPTETTFGKNDITYGKRPTRCRSFHALLPIMKRGPSARGFR